MLVVSFFVGGSRNEDFVAIIEYANYYLTWTGLSYWLHTNHAGSYTYFRRNGYACVTFSCVG